jgi:FkbM family methyltransferase
MARLSYAEALDLLALLRDHSGPDHPDEQMRFIHFCLERLPKSAAQLLQDLWVAYETGERRGGWFVEFGAWDGAHHSNTLYLERELGWSGVLAEPMRLAHTRLAERTAGIDKRCVWIESGKRLLFNECDPPVHSTIDAYSDGDMHAESRRHGTRYEVETVSLNDLLSEWQAPRRIDYLSVDTEGSELDILRAFDFDSWEVGLISVEHNYTTRREGLFELLTAKGFRRKFEALSRADDWYVRA